MLESLKYIEFIDSTPILGTGAFSHVVKVRSKIDGNYYALKKIDVFKVQKADIINLKNEIHIHKDFNHPNIIHFYDCL